MMVYFSIEIYNHKDRYVVLSSLLLVGLRKYYQQYKPEVYLFNGNRKGAPISTEVYPASGCEKGWYHQTGFASHAAP